MAEDAEVIDEGGSGGKVLLIVGLVLGLGLGIGGGFVLFGGGGGDEHADEHHEEVVEKEPEPPKELIDLDIERISVPIYTTRKGRRRYSGNYAISIRFQFADVENKIKVDRRQSALRHNLLVAISEADVINPEDGHLDVEKLRSVVRAKAESLFGKDMFYDVIIQSAVRLSV